VRIVLEESDRELADRLARDLRRLGHTVDPVGTGRDLLDRFRAADLVIVDLGPPDLDGMELLREIRAEGDTPMIAVTGHRTEAARVSALRAGSDDCMERPLGFRELAARIDAVMRRAAQRSGSGRGYDNGSISIDPVRRGVQLDGCVVQLTGKEFDLLWLLASRQGTVISRGEIMARVWGDTWNTRSRTVDTHVSSLRGKLGLDCGITTVRGVGLRFLRGTVAGTGERWENGQRAEAA